MEPLDWAKRMWQNPRNLTCSVVLVVPAGHRTPPAGMKVALTGDGSASVAHDYGTCQVRLITDAEQQRVV